MNTQQLECFTTLAKTLNYAKAAEQLSMTQPAVSRQIKSLENELGTRLFQRTTRSVTLTQVGWQFLPDARQILSIYYRSREWMESFHKSGRSVLRIGYADSHANWLISKILAPILATQKNIAPELTLDQTDANLRRLSVNQLDLVIGMKDAKFSDEAIAFVKLRDEGFVCIVSKAHELARECKKKRQKSVSSPDLWPHRQIIAIPPYLLKHTFSRGHRIIPVNDELDNILCATVSEAYSLTLAGAGFALIPEHLALPHKELVFFSWDESPHAPMGIYCRKEAYHAKNSAICKFISEAQAIISAPCLEK
ncbi:MAG: LysR family transcriptional regulator [Selenomonadaceae bacterium]|nr:LysR family transcriptional regulator [Selenomonadaceae bacterium]